MNFIPELQWRGLLQDIMPGTEEQLEKEMTSGYVGFDPTADSLHIGNLVPVMLLAHLQKAGHKPIVLVGGATGMVGDPSGKTAERQLLTIEDINYNLECQKKQLSQFLDFDCGENSAVIVNNHDWFKEFSFLEFIRDAGKHISVNYMMAKDSVKSRLATGMSFTEFTYQLIQGYDFYHLWKNNNCKLQMGGSDQWGNIVTGTEFIRRKGSGEAFALTAPLIKKADGTKFGKSEGGNVWIDKSKTSYYKFYQYWINASDEDAENFIKVFTFLPKEEIESIIVEHKKDPGMRLLQKKVAEDLTVRVHGKDGLRLALETTQILFGKSTKEDLTKLSSSDFVSIVEGNPEAKIERSKIDAGLSIVDALVGESNFMASNGEARRSLKENAIKINRERCESADRVLTSDDLLNDKYILLQRGKKSFYVLIVE